MTRKLKRFFIMVVEVAFVLAFIDLAISFLGPFIFPDQATLVQWSWRGFMVLVCGGMTWRLYKRCESGEILFDE